MPKDTKPKIFPHRYHPQRTLMQTALEESISRNAHYVSYNPYRYSNPIFRAKGAFQSQEAKQNRLWLEDAIRRASGRHTLQRPKFDRLGCRGRTVYDADQPAPKCGQLYDYWQRPPRHSSAESSSSSCSEVKQPRKKVRAVKLERRGSLTDETIPQASYAIFLRPLSPQFDLDIFGGGQTTYDRKLDEDVPSTEITPDIIEEEPLQNPLDMQAGATHMSPIDTGMTHENSEGLNSLSHASRSPTPSLTWSDASGDESDSSDFSFTLEETSSPEIKKEPAIADSFSGDLDSFQSDPYTINAEDPLSRLGQPSNEPEQYFYEHAVCIGNGVSGESDFYETVDQLFDMFINTEY